MCMYYVTMYVCCVHMYMYTVCIIKIEYNYVHACMCLHESVVCDWLYVHASLCVHVSTFVIILSNIIVIVTCEGGFPIP